MATLDRIHITHSSLPSGLAFRPTSMPANFQTHIAFCLLELDLFRGFLSIVARHLGKVEWMTTGKWVVSQRKGISTRLWKWVLCGSQTWVFKVLLSNHVWGIYITSSGHILIGLTHTHFTDPLCRALLTCYILFFIVFLTFHSLEPRGNQRNMSGYPWRLHKAYKTGLS